MHGKDSRARPRRRAAYCFQSDVQGDGAFGALRKGDHAAPVARFLNRKARKGPERRGDRPVALQPICVLCVLCGDIALLDHEERDGYEEMNR